jgi:hypothetical protein
MLFSFSAGGGSAFGGLIILGAVVPHIVQCPGIFYNKHGDPLGFVIKYEQINPDNSGDGIYHKKDRIKNLFVSGQLFVIGNI